MIILPKDTGNWNFNTDEAPIDGTQFTALLSNSWVSHMLGRFDKGDVYREWRCNGASVPYEPSYPKDYDWEAYSYIRIVAWMPDPAIPEDFFEWRKQTMGY